MCFHLKIYVLCNSFCVFLLERIDVFWMFLVLPAIKNKTIIKNKTEDRQSVTYSSWARLTKAWKLFKPNKPTRQLRFWEFRILRWFTVIDYTVQSTPQDHIHLIIASFWQMQRLFLQVLFYHYWTHQSNLAAKSLQ